MAFGLTTKAYLLAGLLLGGAGFVHAATPKAPLPPPPAYADLVDLAEAAPLVMRAEIRKFAIVEPARAPGLRPGMARIYVEASTQALLLGRAPVGEALRYLVDVPLDSRGKLPALRKQSVLLFARTVQGRVGEVQLVAPDAQLVWDVNLEGRLRGVLAELLAPAAPGRITAVREAISVAGTLAGESETQIFLGTPDGSPASITVHRQPGAAASLGVSFSEVLEGGGGMPARDTLAWYRLACFLPGKLPFGANLSETDADKAQAELDYRLAMEQLGTCPRIRR